MRCWVTSKNQEWVSEATGIPIKEVRRLYEKAREDGVVCTIDTSMFMSDPPTGPFDLDKGNVDLNINPSVPDICEHAWAWVSPAGTSNSARLCRLCHQPDANWLNTIVEISQPDDSLVIHYVCQENNKG